MARFQTAVALAERQRQRSERFVRVTTASAHFMMKAAIDDSKRLSSGRITKKQLREMGHPYGRLPVTRKQQARGQWGRQRFIKGTRQRLPTLPINIQTGRLYRSIRGDLFEEFLEGNARRVLWRVHFDPQIAPYGKFIARPGGTSKMIARPIRRAVTDLAIRRKIANLEAKRAIERS